MPTLDDALKSFTFPITGGGNARLDERDRQNLMQHLAQYGFVITPSTSSTMAPNSTSPTKV
jgi:hypothetical protein